MDKRYQVFVSSTYADLQQERKKVIQALMEMDCIPSGMELFPAADEEQWIFIKKVIDDCDYYLLIIGGRYGSITEDGISYTEKEFDYAVEKGIKVIALIHGSPDDIAFGKSEQNPELRKKLQLFRDKVMTGRLVKFWASAEELPGLVALSITKTIKMYPAIGWVRASQVASEKILAEINDLRNKNDELQKSLTELSPKEQTIFDDITDIDTTFTVHGTYTTITHARYSFNITISWKEIFSLIAPYLLEHPNDRIVKNHLATSLLERSGKSGYTVTINDQEFKTITIQLKAYGLITTTFSETTKGGMALFWTLTQKGEELMMDLRIIRKES